MMPNGEGNYAQDFNVPGDSHHVPAKRPKVRINAYHLPYSTAPVMLVIEHVPLEGGRITNVHYLSIDVDSSTADGTTIEPHSRVFRSYVTTKERFLGDGVSLAHTVLTPPLTTRGGMIRVPSWMNIRPTVIPRLAQNPSFVYVTEYRSLRTLDAQAYVTCGRYCAVFPSCLRTSKL